jgi:hypothetical protein
MLLRGHIIHNIDDIFNALRPTYGLDEYTLQQQTKQQEGESVRVYYSKLKTNLMLIGFTDSPAGARHLLVTFINGLLPDLRRAVRALKPQTVQIAVGMANEAEAEQAEGRKRKPVDHFNFISDSPMDEELVHESEQPQQKIGRRTGNISLHFIHFDRASRCSSSNKRSCLLASTSSSYLR